MVNIDKLGVIKDNAIIFNVKNGLSKLKNKLIKDENGKSRECFFCGDIPILIYDDLSKENKMKIQIAEGRECIEEEILECFGNLKKASSLNDGFEKLKGVFSLLSDGYYILSEEKVIPTDGKGNFFWCVNGIAKEYKFQKDLEKNDKTFLISSQGMQCYDDKIVEKYKKNSKILDEQYCFAIKFNDFYNILLDGHHRASSAYLLNKKVKCLILKSLTEKETKNIEKRHRMIESNFENDIPIVFSGRCHTEKLLQENHKYEVLDN
ncbi:MAG: hypothetical protein ACRC57_00885 [Sarcina sp.]